MAVAVSGAWVEEGWVAEVAVDVEEALGWEGIDRVSALSINLKLSMLRRVLNNFSS